MLPINILERTDHSIIYELPPGKPNPLQPCVEGVESRERVYQTETKGPSCVYYAFNLIRRRIGKNPTEAFRSAREIEKNCSLWRKNAQEIDDRFPISIGELYTEEAKVYYGMLDQEQAKLFLATGKPAKADIKEASMGREPMVPFIEEFINQNAHSNFYDFLLAKRAERSFKLNRAFLLKMPGRLVEQVERTKDYEKKEITLKAQIYDAVVRDSLPNFYDLHFSNWQPTAGIEGLISELKGKGPLVVLGKFGKDQYAEEPRKLENQIGGRDIYGWRKGAQRADVLAGHLIVLVGAKISKNVRQVYFIDPNDPSNPLDRSAQKIYAISYDNLMKHICDRTGAQRVKSEIGFAIYGNFAIPLS